MSQINYVINIAGNDDIKEQLNQAAWSQRVKQRPRKWKQTPHKNERYSKCLLLKKIIEKIPIHQHEDKFNNEQKGKQRKQQ